MRCAPGREGDQFPTLTWVGQTEGCHENGPVAAITVLVVQLTPEARCGLARPK